MLGWRNGRRTGFRTQRPKGFASSSLAPSTKIMINYDDFSKIEIKIGKVINAERVPETDKLLKLEVDFSEASSRTIVSGIAHAISVEDIVGKLLPFVTNLEPQTIRGIESQGMIMVAVDDKDMPVLLEPNKKIKPGSIVR